MAANLRRWDEDGVDELCDLVFGQFMLGNLYQHSTNDHVWEVITHTLNTRTRKAFSKRQVIRKFASLRRWYRAVISVRRYGHFGHVELVPSPDRLFPDLPRPNLDNVHQTVEDVDNEHQTQRAEKRPMQNASVKSKKLSKKADRVSDMTVALKEYTAMTRERFSGKWASQGVPLNNLLNPQLEVILVHSARQLSFLINTFLQYDFDDAYFNDVDSSNGGDLNDDDWTDSECDSEEEVEFNLVNPIVEEIYAYMQ
nr:hypothetical protein CFP56_18694 [Quercus suber]POE72697.1 hypothetical protein CFP56_18696 [Quercus suber]